MTAADDLDTVAEAICGDSGYQLVGPVGAGAFKATFHIIAEGAHKALKVYDRKNKTVRVDREIDAMRLCDHPNVAKLEQLAAIEIQRKEYTYSIEEFIAGRSLAEVIANNFLSADETKSIATALADALSHISGKRLVHRDIKPANIMIREADAAPVLVDFGLVRNLEATSITETWMPHGPGTPYYASPEQLNNDKQLIDWRSDQFSLGVVLTEAITGQHPFGQRGERGSEAVANVASKAGPASWFVEWAKEEGFHPFVKMVEPWPVRRFRDPEQLMQALV